MYTQLNSAYSRAHSEKISKKKVIQDNVNVIWNKNKNNPDLPNIIKSEIKSLNQIVTKRQVSILSFWNKANERQQQTVTKTVTNEVNNINVNSTVASVSSPVWIMNRLQLTKKMLKGL